MQGKRRWSEGEVIRASGLREWPRRRGWQLCGNMERYISVGDEVCTITSARESLAPEQRAALPAALVPAARLLADHVPLHGQLRDVIDDEEANGIWARFCQAARGIQDPAIPAWRDLRDLDDWHLLLLIARTIADGMRYPSLPGAERRQDLPWDLDDALGEDWLVRTGRRLLGRKRVERLLGRLEGVEFLAASAATFLRHDVRALGSLARTMLASGITGVCRHYSVLLQVLAHCARRATGRPRRLHVLTIAGKHRFDRPYAHAWTWLVDERQNRIFALDLTGADWLMDREGVQTVLNRGLNASRFNNVSALLANLLCLDLEQPAHQQVVLDLFPRLIRPETVRGQALLIRLACQWVVAPSVRDRIKAFLRGQRVGRHLPGWRIAVGASGLPGKAMEVVGFARGQHRVLDTLGVG